MRKLATYLLIAIGGTWFVSAQSWRPRTEAEIATESVMRGDSARLVEILRELRQYPLQAHRTVGETHELTREALYIAWTIHRQLATGSRQDMNAEECSRRVEQMYRADFDSRRSLSKVADLADRALVYGSFLDSALHAEQVPIAQPRPKKPPKRGVL